MKKVKLVVAGRSGICPICESNISYTGSDRLEEIHHWICDNCGAAGKESFTYMEGRGSDDDYDEWEDTEFVEHCDVHLKDGTLVELIEPDGKSIASPATFEPRIVSAVCKSGICPLCGGALEYTGVNSQDGGCTMDWVCQGCGATGEEGRKEVFTGEFYDIRDAEGHPVQIQSLSLPISAPDQNPPVPSLFEEETCCTRSFQFMLPPFGKLEQELMICVEYWQQSEPGLLTYRVFVQPKWASIRYYIGKAICRCPVLYDLNQSEEEAEAIIFDLLKTRMIMDGIQDWYEENKETAPSNHHALLLQRMADLRKSLQEYATAEGCAAQVSRIEIAILTAEDLLKQLS